MKIMKQANAMEMGVPGPEDLELINRLAQKKLEADDVFTFAVRLCDNEVDRDWERFSEDSLEKLAELFMGKSGIFDHDWSAGRQSARIYRTEVVREDKLTRSGKPYAYVKAWAYMMRIPANESLIAEIQGGIKKEVSVGCSVSRGVCSICGDTSGSCEHEKGGRYDGKLCWRELEGICDAYEWSFVAVPAQREAGVIKGLALSLKELVRQAPGAREELERLEKDAENGRRWMKELRHEVVRLAALHHPEMKVEVLERMAGSMSADDLISTRQALDHQVKSELPHGPQLCHDTEEEQEDDDSAYLV